MLPRVLACATCVLILKVTVSVMLGYRDYFPPNFSSDFLRGRELYFSGIYHWAFYSHIVSGPLTLVLGLILIGEPLRRRFPQWHRSLGKIQIVLISLVLTPSGLWMAYYAETGAVAGAGFAALAIVTALCALLGWQSALKRRFADHRRWMWRCFLLLCSAVVLRMIAGLATVADVGGTWTYPLAAWASWLVPLAVFELNGTVNRQFRRSASRSAITATGQ